MRAFTRFADDALKTYRVNKDMLGFATALNEKANELIKRAALNPRVDHIGLQKELFETGRDYIRKIAAK